MSRFDAARRAALMQDLLRPLRGQPADLLPFDAVREGLRLGHLLDRGVMEVPLDQIVGSLGRERDFTREFLPRDEALRERWEELEELAVGTAGFPSVELYRVGEAYFVVDGHHRVSVARSLGAPAIEARVQEFLSPVTLSPDESLEEVLAKHNLAEFCEITGLAQDAPGRLRLHPAQRSLAGCSSTSPPIATSRGWSGDASPRGPRRSRRGS